MTLADDHDQVYDRPEEAFASAACEWHTRPPPD
jgi:hypothetical protein